MTFLSAQRWRFAGRADGDETGDTRRDLRFDQLLERGNIDLAILKRRDQCRESAAEHVVICSGGL